MKALRSTGGRRSHTKHDEVELRMKSLEEPLDAKKENDLEEEEDEDENAPLLEFHEPEDEMVEFWSKTSDKCDFTPEYLKGRAVFDAELETCLDMKPFMEIPLYHGNTRGLLGNSYRKVGTWKGFLSLAYPEEKLRAMDERKRKQIADQQKDKNAMINLLSTPKSMFLRVYITKGYNFPKMDSDFAGGKADPYLIVKVGRQKVSTRKRHLRNTLQPDFFESFEFAVTLPGDSEVTIESWDWDGVGDDLIGRTVIDFEDRYFTREWREFSPPPVERRSLHIPTRDTPQGSIDVIIEILSPEQAKKNPLIDITPPPQEEFELRVIAWQVKDCPAYNSFTQMSDLKVKAICNADTKWTDIHWRTKTGIGNFNWRMKWPILLPPKRGKAFPRLTVQAWDVEVVCPNNAIGTKTLPLERLCKRALSTSTRSFYTVNGEKDFWIKDLALPVETKESKRGKPKIKLRVELVPAERAKELEVGDGRGDPNMYPFLPPPEGRIPPFNLMHPLEMCYDILGPSALRKIACFMCCLLILGGLAYFIPMYLSAKISVSWFGGSSD